MIRKLYIPAIAILAFGYPLTAVWTLTLGLEGQPINILVRLAVIVLFLLSLLKAIIERSTIPRSAVFLIIFFFLYGFRLAYDVLVQGIVPATSTASYILLYFFALTFFSAISITVSYDQKDVGLIHKWLFGMLIVTNISLSFFALTSGDIVAQEAFSGRVGVMGADEVTAILNPITVSLMGALLSVFVIGRLATVAKGDIGTQLLHVALFALGIVNLLMGGSRGPIVAFVVAALLAGVSVIRISNKRGDFRVQPRIVFYLACASIVLLYLALSSRFSIFVFDRFKDMFLGRQVRLVEQRDFVYEAAWNDFVSSPLIGNSYLTLNETTMPHNAFLESFAAIGILGGGLYIVCMFIFMQGIWSITSGKIGAHAYAIGLTATALAVMSLTSGAIGQQPEVWTMIALVTCMVGFRTSKRLTTTL